MDDMQFRIWTERPVLYPKGDVDLEKALGECRGLYLCVLL
jgi:hypothetical protein